MRLYADACVAGSLVQELRAHGFDVVYAAEGPPRVPDQIILNEASAADRVLLTEDYDFGALTVRERRGAVGVILIELHGLSTERKIARVLAALRTPDADFRGALTIIEPARTRRRALIP